MLSIFKTFFFFLSFFLEEKRVKPTKCDFPVPNWSAHLVQTIGFPLMLVKRLHIYNSKYSSFMSSLMILMCAENNSEGVPYGAIWALWQQAVMVSSLQWSKTVHRVLQPVLTGLKWSAYQSLQDANSRILERPALPKPLSHTDKTSTLVGHWSHYASSETIP